MTDESDRTARRWPLWLGVGLALLLAGAATGWAASAVLTPAEDVLESTPFTYVAVEPGEVGSSIALNTVAEWTLEPVGANQAVGVVTTVNVEAGAEVSPGDVLYTVNMRPVVIGQGDVPAYRAIGQGARGADVAQLQRLLSATGHYAGPADGIAGAGTAEAIRRWQRALGVERTGVVEQGDVIFVPHLPTRIALDGEIIARGASVSGGEDVVQALPPSPTFVVPVTDAQAGMMPLGTRVEIQAEDSVWEGFASGHERDEMTSSVRVHLEGAEGAVICGAECGQIPATGQSLLTSRIITVETVQGLVVPSAALTTNAAGEISLIDESGARIPVTVITSARGMSVIEGTDAGVRVRVPAAEGAG